MLLQRLPSQRTSLAHPSSSHVLLFPANPVNYCVKKSAKKQLRVFPRISLLAWFPDDQVLFLAILPIVISEVDILCNIFVFFDIMGEASIFIGFRLFPDYI